MDCSSSFSLCIARGTSGRTDDLPDNGAMIGLSGDRAEIIDNVHTGALTSEKYSTVAG